MHKRIASIVAYAAMVGTIRGWESRHTVICPQARGHPSSGGSPQAVETASKPLAMRRRVGKHPARKSYWHLS